MILSNLLLSNLSNLSQSPAVTPAPPYSSASSYITLCLTPSYRPLPLPQLSRGHPRGFRQSVPPYLFSSSAENGIPLTTDSCAPRVSVYILRYEYILLICLLQLLSTNWQVALAKGRWLQDGVIEVGVDMYASAVNG